MDEELRGSRIRGWLAKHPIICAVVVVCIAIGAALGATLLTGEWSLARRIAAGAVAGAGVGLLITAPRIIG
jgi:hypothetical protein